MKLTVEDVCLDLESGRYTDEELLDKYSGSEAGEFLVAFLNSRDNMFRLILNDDLLFTEDLIDDETR
jgi:hypothetical protein